MHSRTEAAVALPTSRQRALCSDKNRKLFEAWDREDPVDDWKRERARRIEQIQGNPNPFVK
jgi:deoxyribonuclease-1